MKRKYDGISKILDISKSCEHGNIFEITFDINKDEFGPYKQLTAVDRFQFWDCENYVYLYLDKQVTKKELIDMVENAIEGYYLEKQIAW